MYAKAIQLLSARWFIHMDTALEYFPLLLSYINGAKIQDEDFKSHTKPYAIAPNLADMWDVMSDDIAPNSVLVLPLDGPITSWRAKRTVEILHKAESNPNIIAGVLHVNSPGGMVHYTDTASDAIKNSTIPFVGYVENMGASAAMWWLSGTKRIFLSSRLDRVGSIGIMTSVMDFTQALRDKLGVKIEDIYAEKSTRKNEEFRAWLEKNDKKPLLDSLNFANEIFHEAIQNNLGVAADSEVFQGAVYYADEAIKLGIAHEISSFSDAVDYAFKLGMKNTIHKIFK